MLSTNQASLVWRHLNGVICLYKQAGRSWERCLESLQNRIVSDLNQMHCREPRQYVRMAGDTSKSVDVILDTNYADHPLVVGPRYIPGDINGFPLKNVGTRISGVCLVGINKGIPAIEELALQNPISTYHIVGKFGLSTRNRAIDGDIVFTCKYGNLKKTRIDKVTAAIQSIHRKHLIKQCGFHPQSQQAYELLAGGNLRPLSRGIPVVYSIKCIDWQLPYFTLEIVIVNEQEDYLLGLVHEIGMRARNLAVGCSIRCLRTSIFSTEDALLEKHWDVQNILQNMDICRRKLESNGECSQYFKPFDSKNFYSVDHTDGYTNEEIVEEEEEWRES